MSDATKTGGDDAGEWLDGGVFGEPQPCFGCGPSHPIGFQLKFRVEGDATVTRFTPGEQYQGPPGILHGGLAMTLGDEIASWTLITQLRKFGFTGRFEGSLHQALRVGEEIEGRGVLGSDRRRIVDVDVELRQRGEKCFSGR